MAPNKALALYRSFLRASRPLSSLPSQNRRQLILKRVRLEISANKEVKAKEELDFLFALGELQLESVGIQAQHLSSLQRKGQLKS